MKRLYTLPLILVALALVFGSAMAQKSATTRLDQKDVKFVKEAAMGGLFEVKMGELAEKNATDDSVKAFGRQMQTDHAKINDDLKGIAQQKKVRIPTVLAGKHARKYSEMAKKTGTAFDAAYMSVMVKAHEEDAEAFRGMSKNSKDADVQAFAARTLTIIEQHLAMARRIQDRVKQAGKM